MGTLYHLNSLKSGENAMFDVIAFDADDTLWHNMPLYEKAQKHLADLLADHIDAESLDKILYANETRNIHYFGYGIKSFTLSMIQTAVEVTNDNLQGDLVLRILNLAKEMLTSPVNIIDNVPDVLARIAPEYKLMIITKGDLIDQHGKVARSGLADYFDTVEVVIEKDPETYLRILQTYHISSQRFLMVGNSLKSDVLPVLAIGGSAVHIPHTTTWAHEEVHIDPEEDVEHVELAHMGLLPAWLADRKQYLKIAEGTASS